MHEARSDADLNPSTIFYIEIGFTTLARYIDCCLHAGTRSYILINGVPRQFRGALATFLGDTLASHAIGGFKTGVGFALRTI